MVTIAAEIFTADNRNTLYIDNLTQNTALNTLWDLWTHYTWKELVVSSGLIISASLFAHFAATTGSNDGWSTLTRGAVGFGFGFFVPRTATHYPTIKHLNGIRFEILTLYQNIGNKLNELATQFSPNSECTEVEKLVILIRDNAKQSYDLSLPKDQIQNQEKNLLRIKYLIENIDKKVSDLTVSLENKTIEEKARLIKEAHTFWQQDFDDIRKTLEPDQTENEEDTTDIMPNPGSQYDLIFAK